MKKNLKTAENFYQNSLFILNSHGCHCAIDEINEAVDDVRRVFKVMALEDKPIRFAFKPQSGLARVSITTGAVEEENILSSLVSIDSDDIKGYKKFFEKNGFFFNIGIDKFEKIDDESLLAIIYRMKTTLSLLSQISETERKNYKKLFVSTLSLLFSPQIEIKIGDFTYKTGEHETFNKAMKIANDRNNESKLEFNSKSRSYIVPDSIYDTHEVQIDIYREFESNPVLDNAIMHAYVNYIDAPYEQRIIIEFLYHIEELFGQIRYVTPDEVVFLNQWKFDWDKIDDKLRDVTVEVAKILIGEEINANVTGVHPEYDIKAMEPKWRVDSLMSALYFSMFYMRPNVEITRLCENPKCGKYFSVRQTNLKQKYCCPECANRANQNRYRARHKNR